MFAMIIGKAVRYSNWKLPLLDYNKLKGDDSSPTLLIHQFCKEKLNCTQSKLDHWIFNCSKESAIVSSQINQMTDPSYIYEYAVIFANFHLAKTLKTVETNSRVQLQYVFFMKDEVNTRCYL